MHHYRYLALVLALFSSSILANEVTSPIDNIHVYNTEQTSLVIYNFSSELVEIDIHGDILSLPPTSGAQFNCLSHTEVELRIEYNEHGFFQVPCSSRVVIDEAFTNQYSQGE